MLTPVSQVMHKELPVIKKNELDFSNLLKIFIQGRFGIVGIIDEKINYMELYQILILEN